MWCHRVTELTAGLLTRRLRSSFSCGREELQLVWTLTFYTHKNHIMGLQFPVYQEIAYFIYHRAQCLVIAVYLDSIQGTHSCSHKYPLQHQCGFSDGWKYASIKAPFPPVWVTFAKKQQWPAVLGNYRAFISCLSSSPKWKSWAKISRDKILASSIIFPSAGTLGTRGFWSFHGIDPPQLPLSFFLSVCPPAHMHTDSWNEAKLYPFLGVDEMRLDCPPGVCGPEGVHVWESLCVCASINALKITRIQRGLFVRAT